MNLKTKKVVMVVNVSECLAHNGLLTQLIVVGKLL